MNQVLKFNRIKVQEPDFKAIDSFVASCIQMNIEAVSNAVSVLNQGQKEYAIESFVYKLIAAIMAEKDKEDIGEWISSGTIFLLQAKLERRIQEISEYLNFIFQIILTHCN